MRKWKHKIKKKKIAAIKEANYGILERKSGWTFR